MGWTWTGIRIDRNGWRRRTGFEWSGDRWIGLRFGGFRLPRGGHRFFLGWGRFHALLTWKSDEKDDL